MARIAPIPWDELTDEARERIEEGLASGMYSTACPVDMAHSPNALRAIDDSYRRSSAGRRSANEFRSWYASGARNW